MIPEKEVNHPTLLQSDYIASLVEGFLLDRKTQGLSWKTLQFYRDKMRHFTGYCEAQSLTQASELKLDFLRRYLLIYAETHIPSGVHGTFRSVRAFLHWVEDEEIIPPEWKNPIRNVKAQR